VHLVIYETIPVINTFEPFCGKLVTTSQHHSPKEYAKRKYFNLIPQVHPIFCKPT